MAHGHPVAKALPDLLVLQDLPDPLVLPAQLEAPDLRATPDLPAPLDLLAQPPRLLSVQLLPALRLS